jgi:hypothetical protein
MYRIKERRADAIRWGRKEFEERMMRRTMDEI